MIVIKYGGHAMGSNSQELAPWIAALKARINAGEQCVIVHGGGPQIDEAITAAGLTKEFVGGYRITTPEIFQIVESVLTGQVLRNLVRLFRTAGINVVGITGTDGSLLSVKEKIVTVNGKAQSLGQVGDVVSVNTKILTTLLSAGFTPIVSPVSTSSDGIGLNINADSAAGAIAGALAADQAIFMTDVPGIYSRWPDRSSLITEISRAELAAIAHTFEAGMAPKVSACLKAVESGAKAARVIDGTDEKSFMKALTNEGGTLVTA